MVTLNVMEHHAKQFNSFYHSHDHIYKPAAVMKVIKKGQKGSLLQGTCKT